VGTPKTNARRVEPDPYLTTHPVTHVWASGMTIQPAGKRAGVSTDIIKTAQRYRREENPGWGQKHLISWEVCGWWNCPRILHQFIPCYTVSWPPHR